MTLRAFETSSVMAYEGPQAMKKTFSARKHRRKDHILVFVFYVSMVLLKSKTQMTQNSQKTGSVCTGY